MSDTTPKYTESDLARAFKAGQASGHVAEAILTLSIIEDRLHEYIRKDPAAKTAMDWAEDFLREHGAALDD